MAGFIGFFGDLGLLAWRCLGIYAKGQIRWRLALAHVVAIGFGSQVVVMVTGAFTGAVFAAQTFHKFSEIGLDSATGPVVAIAMCRELGPVLAGFMVAGRMGAAMAAEIATMRVTEQIDALRSMGVDPVGYLVAPRVLAILVSMPVLVAQTIFIGILAADLLTVKVFGVPEAWFHYQLELHTGTGDLATGLVKSVFFGALIVLVSCRHGLAGTGGAAGVGRAATRAVVDSCLAILCANLLLTFALNRWLPMVSVNL